MYTATRNDPEGLENTWTPIADGLAYLANGSQDLKHGQRPPRRNRRWGECTTNMEQIGDAASQDSFRTITDDVHVSLQTSGSVQIVWQFRVYQEGVV
jgi:hypothetical protein